MTREGTGGRYSPDNVNVIVQLYQDLHAYGRECISATKAGQTR